MFRSALSPTIGTTAGTNVNWSQAEHQRCLACVERLILDAESKHTNELRSVEERMRESSVGSTGETESTEASRAISVVLPNTPETSLIVQRKKILAKHTTEQDELKLLVQAVKNKDTIGLTSLASAFWTRKSSTLRLIDELEGKLPSSKELRAAIIQLKGNASTTAKRSQSLETDSQSIATADVTTGDAALDSWLERHLKCIRSQSYSELLQFSLQLHDEMRAKRRDVIAQELESSRQFSAALLLEATEDLQLERTEFDAEVEQRLATSQRMFDRLQEELAQYSSTVTEQLETLHDVSESRAVAHVESRKGAAEIPVGAGLVNSPRRGADGLGQEKNKPRSSDVKLPLRYMAFPGDSLATISQRFGGISVEDIEVDPEFHPPVYGRLSAEKKGETLHYCSPQRKPSAATVLSGDESTEQYRAATFVLRHDDPHRVILLPFDTAADEKEKEATKKNQPDSLKGQLPPRHSPLPLHLLIHLPYRAMTDNVRSLRNRLQILNDHTIPAMNEELVGARESLWNAEVACIAAGIPSSSTAAGRLSQQQSLGLEEELSLDDTGTQQGAFTGKSLPSRRLLLEGGDENDEDTAGMKTDIDDTSFSLPPRGPPLPEVEQLTRAKQAAERAEWRVALLQDIKNQLQRQLDLLQEGDWAAVSSMLEAKSVEILDSVLTGDPSCVGQQQAIPLVPQQRVTYMCRTVPEDMTVEAFAHSLNIPVGDIIFFSPEVKESPVSPILTTHLGSGSGIGSPGGRPTSTSRRQRLAYVPTSVPRTSLLALDQQLREEAQAVEKELRGLKVQLSHFSRETRHEQQAVTCTNAIQRRQKKLAEVSEQLSALRRGDSATLCGLLTASRRSTDRETLDEEREKVLDEVRGQKERLYLELDEQQQHSNQLSEQLGQSLERLSASEGEADRLKLELEKFEAHTPPRLINQRLEQLRKDKAEKETELLALQEQLGRQSEFLDAEKEELQAALVRQHAAIRDKEEENSRLQNENSHLQAALTESEENLLFAKREMEQLDFPTTTADQRTTAESGSPLREKESPGPSSSIPLLKSELAAARNRIDELEKTLRGTQRIVFVAKDIPPGSTAQDVASECDVPLGQCFPLIDKEEGRSLLYVPTVLRGATATAGGATNGSEEGAVAPGDPRRHEQKLKALIDELESRRLSSGEGDAGSSSKASPPGSPRRSPLRRLPPGQSQKEGSYHVPPSPRCPVLARIVAELSPPEIALKEQLSALRAADVGALSEMALQHRRQLDAVLQAISEGSIKLSSDTKEEGIAQVKTPRGNTDGEEDKEDWYEAEVLRRKVDLLQEELTRAKSREAKWKAMCDEYAKDLDQVNRQGDDSEAVAARAQLLEKRLLVQETTIETQLEEINRLKDSLAECNKTLTGERSKFDAAREKWKAERLDLVGDLERKLVEQEANMKHLMATHREQLRERDRTIEHLRQLLDQAAAEEASVEGECELEEADAGGDRDESDELTAEW